MLARCAQSLVNFDDDAFRHLLWHFAVVEKISKPVLLLKIWLEPNYFALCDHVWFCETKFERVWLNEATDGRSQRTFFRVKFTGQNWSHIALSMQWVPCFTLPMWSGQYIA